MRILLVLVVSFWIVGPVLANELEVDSRIISVEVYQGQARVTRAFELEASAGQHTLVFRGLPRGADSSTVQLEIEDEALRLGRVSHDFHFSPADESQQLRDLRARLDQLERDKLSREHQRQMADEFANHHRELLKALRDGITETGQAPLYELAKTAWADAAEAQRQSFEEMQDLDVQIRELDREIKEARRLYRERLAQEQNASTKLRVEATAAGGRARGTLTYVVDGAHWSPVYIVRAVPAERRAEIVYQANIHQSTGENWQNVSLRLSTGRPAAGGAPQEPDPVYLRKWEPIAMREGVMELSQFKVDAPAMARARAADIDMEEPPPPTQVSASTTGFQAELAGNVTVESGKPAVTLPVLETTAEADFWSVTIPLTAESAFLMARLDNPFQLPLLAGPVQLLVDGRLSGSGQVEETLPGQELELGMGENQNIEVNRTILAEDTSRSGIISRSRHEERRYRIELINRMPVPQRVVVQDRVPISRDDKIRVELHSPDGVEIDDETGLFEWEVELAPGERAEMLTHFAVSYPQDWQITDGF